MIFHLGLQKKRFECLKGWRSPAREPHGCQTPVKLQVKLKKSCEGGWRSTALLLGWHRWRLQHEAVDHPRAAETLYGNFALEAFEAYQL